MAWLYANIDFFILLFWYNIFIGKSPFLKLEISAPKFEIRSLFFKKSIFGVQLAINLLYCAHK